MPTPEVPTSASRLRSLDLLRGLDMLLLTVIGPLLWGVHRVWGLPPWVREQLTHVSWEGLTLWDLIMPLFIFMCGAAVPFALPKRLTNGKPGWPFWRHVLGRVALLWVLGMIAQGNLLTLNPDRIVFYNNTLQAIAAGYLIAALAFLIPWRGVRVALPLLLAGAYGLILATCGDYTPVGNAALRFERWLFPSNHDGYSWTLTSLMFGAMTLCGMHCTELLRSRLTPWRKVGALVLLGGALLGGGLLLGHWEPAIKRVYTVSFTAQALGWGTLALAALYLLADVLRLCRGPGLVTLFGQYALTAYLCEEVFAPVLRTAANLLTQGVPYWLGARPQPFVQALAAAALLTGVLLIRKRLATCAAKPRAHVPAGD